MVPLQGSDAAQFRDTIQANASEINETTEGIGQEIREALSTEEQDSETVAHLMRSHRRSWLGIGIVAAA